MSGIHHMLFGGGGGAVTIVNPLTFNGFTYSDVSGAAGAGTTLTLSSDGTWAITSQGGGSLGAGPVSGNWATPTTAGAGNSYWVRFSITSSSGAATETNWTLSPSTSGANTGWLQLSASRSAFVSILSTAGLKSRTSAYTVDIASDSGGTTIVSTSTITLSGTAQPG